MATTTLSRPTHTSTYLLIAPNTAETARIARDHVASVLAPLTGSDPVDTARLLVSELVTNVFRHTSVSLVTIRTTLNGDRVRIAVSDDSPTQPAVPPSPDRLRTGRDTEDGRGLFLVAALASDWGLVPRPRTEGIGKTVWCELPLGVPG
ncbi:ATP-binding protein [Streptomyces sp. ST2-7A]|uniref:ATP-binding protein n=1 Tax=Streptomyces sp. ST2-7A TaxID=2907214 RepID=UPI001F1675E3|nr:ATP-binding protein [Streptomyces sp. ST2-7A]MCE7078698.1 ATP-binding protein [Streptomyces sp. ST2-7A]